MVVADQQRPFEAGTAEQLVETFDGRGVTCRRDGANGGSFRNGCAIHQFAGALNGIADFGCRNKAGLFRRGISRKRYDVGPAEDVLENVLPLTFVINEFIQKPLQLSDPDR